jgi:hypothetical protein
MAVVFLWSLPRDRVLNERCFGCDGGDVHGLTKASYRYGKPGLRSLEVRTVDMSYIFWVESPGGTVEKDPTIQLLVQYDKGGNYSAGNKHSTRRELMFINNETHSTPLCYFAYDIGIESCAVKTTPVFYNQ